MQLLRVRRWLAEQKISPWLALPLGLTVYVGLIALLRSRTDYAAESMAAAGVFLAFRLAATHRTEWLELAYGRRAFRRLRIIENLVAILPFLLYLLYERRWWLALATLALALGLSFLKTSHGGGFVLPTPFRRGPFEFTAGFRGSWPVLPVAAVLCWQMIRVDNPGLGYFTLILLFLTALNFYLRPEPVFFVWSYDLSPRAFLWRKMRSALLAISLLTLPVLLLLLGFYPARWGVLLGLQLSGYALLVTIVCAKYAAYPSQLDVPQGFFVLLCISFPPLVLVFIPLFYQRAVLRLTALL